MPGSSGVTVVTNSCAFLFCTRGCGRIARPAFPAPSDIRGQEFHLQQLARMRRDRGVVFAISTNSSSPAKAGDPVFQKPGWWSREAAAFTRESGWSGTYFTSPRLRGEVRTRPLFDISVSNTIRLRVLMALQVTQSLLHQR